MYVFVLKYTGFSIEFLRSCPYTDFFQYYDTAKIIFDSQKKANE